MKKKYEIPSYESYVASYQKKQNQLAKRGYEMYDILYSKAEYEVMYKAYRSERLEQVDRGERKAATNVMRDLVNDQAYRFSKAQAIKQVEAAKVLGSKISILKAMHGDTRLGEILKAQKEMYLEQGMSTGEANLLISQIYFGSD